MSLKTFIMHYTPLKDRHSYIINNYEYNKLDYEFVTDYDREVLSMNDISLFDLKSVSYGEISLTYKHLHSYKKILDTNINIALILEDDQVLDINFSDKIASYIKQLPENWDICHISHLDSAFHISNNIIDEKTPNVFLKGIH